MKGNNNFKNGSLRLAVSAGELSGDIQAAKCIEALKKLHPDATIRGMGGKNLRACGVDTIVDLEKSAGINGFNMIEIIGKSFFAFLRMVRLLMFWKPDLLLIVDYPDFNLRLARIAKLLRIPVFCFIPPKAWAWRKGRVKVIQKVAKQTAVIFPFEPQFYQDEGYDKSIFVGHPLADELKAPAPSKEERETFLKSINLDPKKPVLAFFPGSRESEFKRHIKPALAGLNLIRASHPEVQVVMALADSINKPSLLKRLPKEDWIKTYGGPARDVLKYSDAGLLKSGTCNLEAAFLGLPFVCFYTVPKITYSIAKRVVQLDQYSPVNIVKRNTVTELIQENLTPEKIKSEVEELLFNNEKHLAMRKNLEAVSETLTCKDEEIAGDTPGERVAHLALNLAEKHRRSQKISRRLFKYLRPYRKQFVAAMLCMVFFGASDGAIPFLVRHILDGIFKEGNRELLYVLPVILIIFFILRAAADFGQHFLMAKTGHSIVRDFRNNTNVHLLNLSPDFFLSNSTGNILSRFTSDVMLVKELLTNSLGSVIRDSIRIIALLTAAFYLDPVLAVIAFLVFPLGLIPVYKFGKRMRRLSKRGQEAIGTLSSMLQESIIGHKVVRIFGREQYEKERFEEENDRLNNTFIKSERIRALTGPVNEVLGSLAISGVILYGGFTVIGGIRSQGEFIAFLLSVFLLYDPFKKLSRINSTVQQGFSGAERIFELLDIPPSIEESKTTRPLGAENSIEFDNVTFTYDDPEQPVLRNISLKVDEGGKVALVGFSGAGKTTLIDLVPRFLDPYIGTVKIGGTNIKECSLKELRSRIAMVGQHTFLFNDTIYNNIAYGNENAAKEDVYEAARAAFAYDFVSNFPNGFDTIAGESGLTLSGGERQRIAIARAILKNAPILILDEATASLDNKSEREVQAALERLEQDRTTLVIAHRLSTVRNADSIVVLEEGRIVEVGTHDQLLGKHGPYSKLYALQFSEHKKVREDNAGRIH